MLASITSFISNLELICDLSLNKLVNQVIKIPRKIQKKANKTIGISIHFNQSEQTNNRPELETQTSGTKKKQQAQRKGTNIVDCWSQRALQKFSRHGGPDTPTDRGEESKRDTTDDDGPIQNKQP